jgi:glycosyltransferase involved in cell wall biosynthesis
MATRNGTQGSTTISTKQSDVWVIIPTYNEADTIGGLLADLAKYGYPVVVVDDSTNEETTRIAVERKAHVIRNFGKRGLGPAILDGLTYARGMGARYAIVMDAGGTHRAKDARMLMMVAQRFGFDVTIGSRFIARYQVLGWRTLLSRVATWMVRAMGVVSTDATSGFRCYRLNDTLFSIFALTQAKGHAFQFEILAHLVRRGAKVGEVNIPYVLTGRTTLRFETMIEAMKTWLRLLTQEIGRNYESKRIDPDILD